MTIARFVPRLKHDVVMNPPGKAVFQAKVYYWTGDVAKYFVGCGDLFETSISGVSVVLLGLTQPLLSLAQSCLIKTIHLN